MVVEFAGSALAANGLASNAFVVTHIAAAAAGLTWAMLDWKINAHPTMLGMITGAVAGLVAITPASGFVGPVDAICTAFTNARPCIIETGSGTQNEAVSFRSVVINVRATVEVNDSIEFILTRWIRQPRRLQIRNLAVAIIEQTVKVGSDQAYLVGRRRS